MPNIEYKQDIDIGFVGFESRTNSSALKTQFLQNAENVRIDRGHAYTRKGLKNLTTLDINQSTDTIYASAKYVDQSGNEFVALVLQNRLLMFNPTTGSIVQYLYPTGRTVAAADNASLVQGINMLFILRGEPSALKACTVTSTNGSSVMNVSCTAHGYIAGDEVIVSGSTDTSLNGAFRVTTLVNANQFTVTLAVPSANNHTGSASVQKGKPVLTFDGSNVTVVNQGVISGSSSNFPPCSLGIFFGNRFIVKRDRDKIATSDYLDYNQWDLTMGQFTINLGAYDSIVGFTPWLDNEFLIFEKNSIYRARVENNAYAVSEAPDAASYISTITNSFGSVSHKSIVNSGRYVFFLTQNGIYQLEPQLDLKLINSIEPLSSPINDYILSINKDYVKNVCGAYYNNRLYLAVPLGASTVNNKILIFNNINKSWESVDSYAQLDIKNFIEVSYLDQKRLIIVTPKGFYLMEEKNGDELTLGTGPVLSIALPFSLSISTVSQYPIPSKIKTRKYTFGTSNSKRYSTASVEVDLETTSKIETIISVQNPDSTETYDTFEGVGSEDYIRRMTIGKRGISAEITVFANSGRPIYKGVSIDATGGGRYEKSEQ